MTASLSISANPRMPAPTNEPARDFIPGSAESRSVSTAIAGLRSVRRELAHVVDGQRIMTAQTQDVIEPHDHASVVGTMAVADEGVTKQAIASCLAAQHDWSRTSVVGACRDHAPRW
jgi:1-pyrroline-5-carboxylate dehydrogenase